MTQKFEFFSNMCQICSIVIDSILPINVTDVEALGSTHRLRGRRHMHVVRHNITLIVIVLEKAQRLQRYAAVLAAAIALCSGTVLAITDLQIRRAIKHLTLD